MMRQGEIFFSKTFFEWPWPRIWRLWAITARGLLNEKSYLEFKRHLFFFCKVQPDDGNTIQQPASFSFERGDTKFSWTTSYSRRCWPEFLLFGIEILKVRTVTRSIYKRTIWVMGLNVVYLQMFNNDNTKHVSEWECAHNNGRGVP